MTADKTENGPNADNVTPGGILRDINTDTTTEYLNFRKKRKTVSYTHLTLPTNREV